MDTQALREQVQRIHTAVHGGTIDVAIIDEACDALTAAADAEEVAPVKANGRKPKTAAKSARKKR